jgi:hypothetical protein
MAELAPSVSRPAVVGVPAGTSFVEWGAVLASGAMAAAISFVLLTFGTAIGLSFVSPWANAGASTKIIASLAVFWTMAQQIGAAMVGGYIAGRMRSRWGETADEVEFRDGLHGGLVWAVGVIISAALLLSAAGAVARTGTEVAGRVASSAAANADPLTYQADVLLRTGGARGAATPGAAQPAPTGAQVPSSQNADQRAEIVRILAKSVAAGGLSEADRSYLAATVAQRTGLPQPEAEKRVNEAYAEASRAAREAADKVRRAAIFTGFVTAAGLLVALGAAWWAAQRGAHHRDNSIPARFFTPAHRRPIA